MGTAIHACAGLGAGQLGAGTQGFGFGAVEFFTRNDIGFKQGLVAGQRAVSHLGIGHGFGGVGLGCAKFGRCQGGQHLTCVHALANVGVEREHTPCKRGVDALGAFFVPYQTGGQLDRDALSGFGLHRVEQCQLRVARRKAQLLALHDGFGHGRLGRCLWVEQQISQHTHGQCGCTRGVSFGGGVGECLQGAVHLCGKVLSYAHATFIVEAG